MEATEDWSTTAGQTYVAISGGGRPCPLVLAQQ